MKFQAVLLGIAICLLRLPHLAFAETSLTGTQSYVRLLEDPVTKEPVALQTSIEALKGEDGKGPFQIDLVSAVHIGEKDYYHELNKRFQSYNAVLFELIADENTPRHLIGKPSDSPVSAGQKGLQQLLGLSFQLEEVNYRARNFVHADMSPEQFADTMSSRGESLSQMFLKMMLHSLAENKNGMSGDLSDLMLMAFSEHRAIGFRRSLARQFNNMESMLSAINGAEGSTIISERNRVAVKVAAAQLEIGRRKLAIFYGGAHMSNMKEQCVKKFQVTSDGAEWLDAWKLRVK